MIISYFSLVRAPFKLALLNWIPMDKYGILKILKKYLLTYSLTIIIMITIMIMIAITIMIVTII